MAHQVNPNGFQLCLQIADRKNTKSIHSAVLERHFMSNLIALKKIETTLRTSSNLREIKHIHDKAEALRHYSRAAGENLSLQNQYAELRLRAERRCGELLPTYVKHGGDRTKARFDATTLRDLGISKFQSHRWQSMALVPTDAFEEHVARIKESNRELTSIGLYRLSKEFLRRRRMTTRLGRLREPATDNVVLVQGDFRDYEDRFKGIDIIITDLPYAKSASELYGDLARFASRVLKPGGSLLTMAGLAYLPDVLEAMTQHMTYHWMLAYDMPGPRNQVWARKVISSWKPVLWFTNGKYEGNWVVDSCLSGGPDKKHHHWGQSESGIEELVERFTYPGQTILDPACGAGTTGVVALRMGRKFVGIDIDKRALEKADSRFASIS
jgi:SAM-dependent methyltransferase